MLQTWALSWLLSNHSVVVRVCAEPGTTHSHRGLVLGAGQALLNPKFKVGIVSQEEAAHTPDTGRRALGSPEGPEPSPGQPVRAAANRGGLQASLSISVLAFGLRPLSPWLLNILHTCPLFHL